MTTHPIGVMGRYRQGLLLCVLAMGALLFALLTGRVSHAAVTPSLVEPVARLDYGKPSGVATMILKVDGLDAAGLSDKALVGEVTDLNVQSGPPTVKRPVSVKELTPAGASSRLWVLSVDASEVSPATSQSRWINVVLSGKDVTIPYTLTNGSTAKFAWTVKGMPALTVEPGEPLPVSINVGPVQASKVKVLQSTLAEKNFKSAFAPNGLKLCKSEDPSKCSNAIDIELNLPANSANQLFLHGSSGAGVYDGVITIAAFEKPEGDSFPMVASSSTWIYKAGGVLLIFTSASIALFVTGWLRNRQNRAQLLIPVSRTLDELVKLKDEYKTGELSIPASSIEQRLTNTSNDLAMSKLLDNGLPPETPMSTASTSAASVDAFRKYVQAASDWTQSLKVLLHEGLMPAWRLFDTTTDVAIKQKAIDAVSAINKLIEVAAPPGTEPLRATLRTILATMNQPPAGSKDLGFFIDQLTRSGEKIGSPEQLRIEVAGLNLISWAFLVLVTTLSGSYIMVVAGPNSLGFGTLADYFLCILWGLGLPGGAQALTATTGSIATTFGITKPIA